MDKLEAVNMMRHGLGVPSANALDTGSNSLSGEAESFLDAKVKSILGERRWHNNTQYEVELPVPDVRIEVGDITGTFQFEELVTEGGSGATGTFRYIDTSAGTNYLYLVTVSGTFVGDANVVGGTSGAAALGASVTSIDAAKHAVNADWIRVAPSARQTHQFSRVGNFLYDPIPD